MSVIEGEYTANSLNVSLSHLSNNITAPLEVSRGILATGMLVQEFLKDSFNLSRKKTPDNSTFEQTAAADRCYHDFNCAGTRYSIDQTASEAEKGANVEGTTVSLSS